MESVSQNGILKQEEFRQFKERTVGLRFKQQISYGVGAAMVFGLVGALANWLLPIASATIHAALAGGAILPVVAPILGLAAIPVIGVGLIYMSAKFLSESTLMEQDFQAKKIGMAARGHIRAQEQEKPIAFPANGMADKAELKDTPQTTINERMLGDKVISLAAVEKPTQAPVTHVERIAANNSNIEQQARA